METVGTESRRNQVLVGALPNDFLRISNNANHQLPISQAQYLAPPPVVTGSRLSITIGQATLVKNYGLTKMDPYVRIRVGHSVLETHTAVNGGKNPVWNKVFQIMLQPGVDSLYLEIFDERSFTLDDKIAWTHIVVPEKVFAGETVDDWYTLSGKQGEQKEGSIFVVFSHTNVLQSPSQQYLCQMPGTSLVFPLRQQPVVVLPQGIPMAPYCGYQPIYPGIGPTPQQAIYQPQIPPANYTNPIQAGYPAPSQPGYPVPSQPGYPVPSQAGYPAPGPPANYALPTDEKDIDTLVEMFPGFDRSVIQSVLASNQNNKEATINQLLALSS